MPDADARARGARAPARSSSSPTCIADTDTARYAACAAARRRLGREGRHRHQLRAPHLAPARLPAAARRGAARLVDRRRGRPAHGLRATPSPTTRPAEIFREHAALSALENGGGPRLRHRRPRRPRRPTTTRCRRSSGRVGGPARFFADGRFFTPDGRARLVAGRRSAAAARPPRLPARAQHRPRPRPVAHDDAHRPRRRASPAHRRALRRDPPADADGPRHRRRRPRRRLGTPGRRTIVRALVTDRVAPGHGLRADALDGRVRRATPASARWSPPPPTRSRASRRSRRGAVEVRRYAPPGTASRSAARRPAPAADYWARRPYRPRLAGRARRCCRARRLGGLGPRGLRGARGRDRRRRPIPSAAAARIALIEDGARRRRALHRPRAGRGRPRRTSPPPSTKSTQPRSSPAGPAPRSPTAAPIVCACFDVGLNTIAEAIASGRATSVAAIGATL